MAVAPLVSASRTCSIRQPSSAMTRLSECNMVSGGTRATKPVEILPAGGRLPERTLGAGAKVSG